MYSFSAATEHDNLLQCLLNFPDADDEVASPHPLDFQALATAQNQDNHLLQELQAKPHQYYASVLIDHNVQLT